MTTVALDASVTMAWVLAETDVRAELARKTVESGRALVPRLWWFEVRNALIVNERRGRLSEPLTEQFLTELSRFAISLDDTPSETRVMALARRHRLTVYDAAYLELALREHVPLATLDGPLAAAAGAEGVSLLGE